MIETILVADLQIETSLKFDMEVMHGSPVEEVHEL